MLASCSTRRPTELLCDNHSDDDDDGKIDCLDPDCHALEACREGRDVIGPIEDAGDSDPIVEPPPSASIDSSTPPPPADPVDSGTDAMVEPFDAGVIVTPPVEDAAPPPECTPACAATEMCQVGMCIAVAVVESGAYQLKVIAAGAPDMDFSSRCYDGACGSSGLSPPYGFCTCPPDTFVRAVRLRGSEALEIGVTSVKTDDHAAIFNDPPFDLELEPGDVLSFEVWDADLGVDPDDKMYECKPDLTMLAPGPISCSAPGGPFNVQTLTVRAELLTAPQ
jgi:hypothetical protein